MNKFLCGALLAMMAAQTAYAQDDVALPAATTAGNASYLSGGIGLDESEAMKAVAPKYSLELIFSARTGKSAADAAAGANAAYIADVQVKISDRSGNVVIDTVSQGPYLLANLPDGSYQVAATSDGVTKTQRIALKKGAHQRLVFSWGE